MSGEGEVGFEPKTAQRMPLPLGYYLKPLKSIKSTYKLLHMLEERQQPN